MGAGRHAILDRHQTSEVIRAGGGIVARRSGDHRLQVAVIHRPLREDWSFPKGKLEPGETLEECALREVLEETGLACRLISFLGHTEYRDRKERHKVVAYWLMAADRYGRFVTNGEVDELRWVDSATAGSLLSYERDAALLAAFAASDEATNLLP